MRLYVVMSERLVCALNCLCRDCDHDKLAAWVPEKYTTKEGVATAHLLRFARGRARKCRYGYPYTGRFTIRVAETDDMAPLWDQAEESAYMIGGTDAVRRMRKARVEG